MRRRSVLTRAQALSAADLLMGSGRLTLVTAERYPWPSEAPLTVPVLAVGYEEAHEWVRLHPDGVVTPLRAPSRLDGVGAEPPLTDAQERGIADVVLTYMGRARRVAHEAPIPGIGLPYGDVILEVTTQAGEASLIRVTWTGLIVDERFLTIRDLRAPSDDDAVDFPEDEYDSDPELDG